MRVSISEAMALVKKAFEDDFPIAFLILTPGLSASIAGFISRTDNVSFDITHLDHVGIESARVTVEWGSVVDCSYRDIREANPDSSAKQHGKVANALSMKIGAVECAMYELNE
jgi:hypothetical protein